MRVLQLAVIALLLGTPAASGQTPAAWEALAEGNRHFVAGSVRFESLAPLRAELSGHQNPAVTVLSCSDSRVPPELVFDSSLGELFVIRGAGNTADTFGLASIEYAVAQGFTKLIVVLGHEHCGAVKAAQATEDPPSASLVELVQRIRASFIGLKPDAPLEDAVRANARAAAAWLPANSRIIRDAVAAGKVAIIAAYYDLDTGEVKRLD
jgi:carbonic anhydrase